MDKKEIISSIVEKIKVQYQPQMVILFGSYADGSANEDSDIDLLIIKETEEKHRERSLKVRRILREENSLVGMDIIVFTPEELSNRIETGDSFISSILERSITLYVES